MKALNVRMVPLFVFRNIVMYIRLLCTNASHPLSIDFLLYHAQSTLGMPGFAATFMAAPLVLLFSKPNTNFLRKPPTKTTYKVLKERLCVCVWESDQKQQEMKRFA